MNDRTITVEEVENDGSILDEVLDALDADPKHVCFIKRKTEDIEPVAVLVSVKNSVADYLHQ